MSNDPYSPDPTSPNPAPTDSALTDSTAPAAPPPNPSPDDSPAPDAAPPDSLVQPAGSKISFIPGDNSLTFIVPHSGFRGPAGFFLLFALIWDGISVPAFIAMLLSALHDRDFFSFLPVIFLLFFVTLGGFMMLAAIQIAYRKAVLLATAEEMVFTQTGPLRKSEQAWPRAKIAAISASPSGTTINDHRLLYVKVWSTDGTSRGMFDGHSDDEIKWFAATLRQFYRVKNEYKSADE